jgi:hypothetical protein
MYGVMSVDVITVQKLHFLQANFTSSAFTFLLNCFAKIRKDTVLKLYFIPLKSGIHFVQSCT